MASGPLLLTISPSLALPHRHLDGDKDIAARVKSFRRAAKVSKANHGFAPGHDYNCKKIIGLIF